MTVRADADPDAGGSDRAEIGAREVSLAEMHEVGAKLDRLAPIIVDDKLAAMGRRNLKRARDLGLDRAVAACP